MLKLTILAENKVRKSNLLAEHGLSIWIELDEKRFLFDTGQSDVYLTNAHKLGIDVTGAEAIILSHGHYDHGGGLIFYPYKAKTRLIAHPAVFTRKVSQPEGGQLVYTGLPENLQQWPDLQLNKGVYKLSESAYAVTEIETVPQYKSSTENMYIEDNNHIYPDKMIDEQMMVIDRECGLVVILGCSHPGVLNCLQHVKKHFPNRKIDTVIGGMHLINKDDDELAEIVAAFRDLTIARLIPLHCTGLEATCKMKAKLGDKVFLHQTGDQIDLD